MRKRHDDQYNTPIDTLTLGVPTATDNTVMRYYYHVRPNDGGQCPRQIRDRKGHGLYRIAVLIRLPVAGRSRSKIRPKPVKLFTKDTTINCNTPIDTLTLGVPTATDNCSDAILLSCGSNDSGHCPTNPVITRTWTLSDSCANLIICVQKLRIQDTTKPVLTLCAKTRRSLQYPDRYVDTWADCNG